METLGIRIKRLRKAAGLTQKDLAEKLGISLKSLQRYEKEKTNADSYVLAKIVTFFDVSVDYLLGTCSYEQDQIISERTIKSQYFKQYIQCKNNYSIEKESIYYWIYGFEGQMGGQTEFVSWLDKLGGKEIRKLRQVKPERAIEMCTKIIGKPMVLNSHEDAIIFMIYGGHAIVKKDICEKYMPWYLEDFIVESENVQRL